MAWSSAGQREPRGDVGRGLQGWAHRSHSPGHWQHLAGAAALMRRDLGTAGRHCCPVLGPRNCPTTSVTGEPEVDDLREEQRIGFRTQRQL